MKVTIGLSLGVTYVCIYVCIYLQCVCTYVCMYIQGVSRLVDITAGGDFLRICDQNISYKHVSDFGRLGVMTA